MRRKLTDVVVDWSIDVPVTKTAYTVELIVRSATLWVFDVRESDSEMVIQYGIAMYCFVVSRFQCWFVAGNEQKTLQTLVEFLRRPVPTG
jgi:hypothetical protein